MARDDKRPQPPRIEDRPKQAPPPPSPSEVVPAKGGHARLHENPHDDLHEG